MKRNLTLLVLLFTGIGGLSPVWGQTHEDLFRFSDQNWSFGTARSAAMGGAYTSLGADLSSMMLNPAGLGMYRRSEMGFTLGYTDLTTKTSHNDQRLYNTSASRGRFAMHNIGGAFNVYNGSGALTSFTLGFTYNKLIDHNAQTQVRSLSRVSMADLFLEQINTANNGNPLTPDDVADLIDNNGNYAGIMGAVLGAGSFLLEYDDDAGHFHLDNTIRAGSDLYSEMLRKSNGSTGQFDLSGGFNFGNQLYLGFGLGMQSIYYNEDYEFYEHTEDGPSADYELDNYLFRTNLRQTGSAVNFKIGAIVRPIEELRIGLSFHSPTYISMNDRYSGRMDTRFYGNEQFYAQSGEFRGSYNIRTPMRLLAGISYTFFDTAILSLDYERAWYNQMKLRWEGTELSDVTDEVKAIYQPANNLRVGLETMLAPNWFGRVGFAYYGSMYNDNYPTTESGFDKYDGSRLHYSAGFGYRSGNWGIDLAYVYMDNKDADYIFRYDIEEVGRTLPYTIERQRHTVSVTSSWRF